MSRWEKKTPDCSKWVECCETANINIHNIDISTMSVPSQLWWTVVQTKVQIRFVSRVVLQTIESWGGHKGESAQVWVLALHLCGPHESTPVKPETKSCLCGQRGHGLKLSPVCQLYKSCSSQSQLWQLFGTAAGSDLDLWCLNDAKIFFSSNRKAVQHSVFWVSLAW